MKNNRRGLFIVLEGLDKCGKSTQTELLSEALDAKKMQFPDRSTSMGLIISDYLKGKRDINDQVIHLLFSANRWEAQNTIIETLNKGINIVCDRYAYSGVAFSSAKGLPIQWCKQCDSGLPKPDLVIYLRAPIKQLKDRGDFGAERYEKQEFQQQVQEVFDKMAQEEQFNIISAIQTKEEIFSQIMELINDYPQNAQINTIEQLWS
ncbi:unnamed protein product (macronuclear) [Paramecium tetraurelia]|uniref:Thymidylate kinase n=1 Tax=Paramecium tetraurelia TaxID=5888 RepID=A0CI69_PARTE|nr:uncharacterized protein GSPATT00007621001 [Paramecium tetraurelia]CAK70486.1 unnamed protein product [Paramecium tetraurelia]|eukprot:XP_001437883.1 hypothetical protein (macronuclear) [Paramecium tetraurelia strain d4-2]